MVSYSSPIYIYLLSGSVWLALAIWLVELYRDLVSFPLESVLGLELSRSASLSFASVSVSSSCSWSSSFLSLSLIIPACVGWRPLIGVFCFVTAAVAKTLKHNYNIMLRFFSIACSLFGFVKNVLIVLEILKSVKNLRILQDSAGLQWSKNYCARCVYY